MLIQIFSKTIRKMTRRGKFLTNEKWSKYWKDTKYEQIRTYLKDMFKDLLFVDKTHQYYLHGKNLYSVSAVTSWYKPKFDSDSKAKEMYEKYYDDPSSKYYHMEVDQILEQWENTKNTACIKGTDCHEFGESCFYFMLGQYDNILPEFKNRLSDGKFYSETPKEEAVVNFWIDLPECFIPIAAENMVYVEELGYAGTFDILFYYDATIIGRPESESGFVIFDYKTNTNLFRNFNNETLLPPFNDLLNCSINTYKLQLSLYQLALNKIGCVVRGRRLIWLKDDYTYEKFDLNDYSKRLEFALNSK